mmetsp:Transcript_10717/g.46408  ORF Transcript_10717/g.46408 Transcript_10717/m.46408 type:complete len:85 (-) Transcript_10717:539-793(-)
MASFTCATPALAARAAVTRKLSAKSQKQSRVAFRVRAADEEKAAKPAEEKKPEPIGPPRGSKVRLSPLRFPNESRPRRGRVLDI